MSRWKWFLLALLLLGAPARALSAVTNLGTPVYVTQGEIAAALQRASGDSAFAAAGATLSANVEDKPGNLAIDNNTGHSDHVGIFQMDNTDIKAFANGMTAQQFAASSVDVQAAAWTRFMHDGANGYYVKKLAAAGNPFDGQPNDDALAIACVQLGIGHCDKAIGPPPSCSRDQDANGVSFCTMAAEIRGNAGTVNQNIGGSGSTKTAGGIAGDNSMATLADSGGAPGYTPNGGTTMPLGNTAYCWSCDVVVYALAIFESTTTNAIPELTSMLVPVAFVIFGIALVWKMMEAIIIGTSPLRPAGPMLIKFMFVSAILISGGQNIVSIIDGEVIGPMINGGAQLGQAMAWSADQVLSLSISTPNSSTVNQTIPNGSGATYIQLFNITPVQGSETQTANNDCTYNATAKVSLTLLIPAETATTSLACTVHHVEATVQQIGTILMGVKSDGTTAGSIDLGRRGVNVAGMAITTSSMLGMLKFGGMILDVVMDMTLITVFVPYLIFCATFRSTFPSIRNYAVRILHGFITLAISGMVAIIGLMCLLQSLYFGSGLDPYGTTLDPVLIVNSASQMANAFSVTHPSTWSGLITFFMFAYAGSSICNNILDQSSMIVAQLTGTRVSRTLSTALSVTMATALRIATQTGPTLLAPAAGSAGKLFGALTTPAKE